jgi:hypothetical protein
VDEAVNNMFNYVSFDTFERVVTALLVNGDRRISFPDSEEVEFFRSVWLENVRFSILEHLNIRWFSNVGGERMFATLKKPFSAMFLWPPTNPWCVYSTIHGLPCEQCPHFILSGSTQRSTFLNERSLCWSKDGYWVPLGEAIGSLREKNVHLLLSKVIDIYISNELPLHYREEG